MKWKNPPLGLFAIPPLIGLAAAYVGFAYATFLVPTIGLKDGTMLGDWAPLFCAWFCLLLTTAATVVTIPVEWGDPKEMSLGVWFGVGIMFVPQICGVGLLLCAFWFLAIISGWIFMSSYQWKYDVSPFRTGFWLGLGGPTGMFLGSWVMGSILF